MLLTLGLADLLFTPNAISIQAHLCTSGFHTFFLSLRLMRKLSGVANGHMIQNWVLNSLLRMTLSR